MTAARMLEEQRIERRKSRNFAIKLLRRNRPIDEIVEDTELTMEEILSIQQELEKQEMK